jgi:hypothetical protein
MASAYLEAEDRLIIVGGASDAGLLNDVWELRKSAPATALTTVSAASFDGSSLAAESIVAAFGTNLATATQAATTTAVALRVRANGQQVIEPVAQWDAAQNRFVAAPIDLSVESEQVFLILFGTGLRYRSSLSSVSARIGGIDAQVLFAGAQGDFAGLDQVNVSLPRSLTGRGEVDVVLMVDGKAANTVKASIK